MWCNNMELTFQYISDTHLEHRENVVLEPLGDVLLLAGDIGSPVSANYNQFLQHQSLHFEKVFVITGNHEYYGSPCNEMHTVEAQCRDVCRSMPRQNVHFLQNEAHEVRPGLSIFGSTFWTEVPDKKMSLVQSAINDYECISGLTPTLTNKLHNDSVMALKECLDGGSGSGSKWIVMSHHLPKLSLIAPRYKHCGAVNYGFASDNEIADDPRIVAWVYGHTHTCQQVGKFYCNPVGYPGENYMGKGSCFNKCFSV